MSIHFLDITKEHCPMTFVKVKLKLEEMAAGDELEILLSDGEPIENVPKSVEMSDCRILVNERSGQHFRLRVVKD